MLDHKFARPEALVACQLRRLPLLPFGVEVKPVCPIQTLLQFLDLLEAPVHNVEEVLPDATQGTLPELVVSSYSLGEPIL